MESSALRRGKFGVTEALMVAEVLTYLPHWSIVIDELCASNLAEKARLFNLIPNHELRKPIDYKVSVCAQYSAKTVTCCEA